MSNKRCPICRGNLNQGVTGLTFKKNHSVIVVENIPALTCENCKEAVIDVKNSSIAFKQAQEEIKRGVSLEFCKFVA